MTHSFHPVSHLATLLTAHIRTTSRFYDLLLPSSQLCRLAILLLNNAAQHRDEFVSRQVYYAISVLLPSGYPARLAHPTGGGFRHSPQQFPQRAFTTRTSLLPGRGFHKLRPPGLVAKIISASIANDGTIQARFTLTDPKGIPLDRNGIDTPGPFLPGLWPVGSPTTSGSTSITSPGR